MKLHNKELHNLYSTKHYLGDEMEDNSRGGDEKCIQNFVEKSEAITLPRYIWQDNVKMNFKERDGSAWTGLVWLRVGTSCRLL